VIQPRNRNGLPTELIYQASHGFTGLFKPVRFTGSAWVLSQADTPENARWDGLLVAIPSTNAFVIQTGGRIVGASGWTPGPMFVEPATAGELTAIAPEHMSRVLIADSASTGFLCPRSPVCSVSTSDPGTAAATDGDLWFKY
jgi:hypothetical protein